MARANLTNVTSRRPFTLLGIVLALLVIAAFVLVAINASTGQGTAVENVVVATSDLPPRVPIDASTVQIKSIPVGGYPSSILFHKTDEVKGMVPLVTIVSGQPITSNMISKPGAALGSQAEYLPIPSGFVAVTLPTSEQQGVAGYIQSDDYIAVIATVDVNGKIASGTVFTNLHVIRVGPMTSTQGQATNSAPTSLTVVVTECQAEYMTWFLTFASLKYTLESYHDYAPTASQARDPNCASVDAAKGVNLKTVQAAYPDLF